MHNIKPYSIAALVVVLVGGFLWFNTGDDEKQIHKQLDALETLISKSSEVGQLTLLTEAKKASQYFAEDLYVEAVPNSGKIQDRDQLTGYLVSARKVLKTIELSLSNRQTIVDEGEERALVNLTGKIKFEDRSGQSDRYSQRYQMSLVKEGGEWLISEVKMVE